MKKCTLFLLINILFVGVLQLKAEDVDADQNRSGNATRTEKRSFTNVSEIVLNHQYGDVVMRESNSDRVDLEIQYFDSDKGKASCDISSSGKQLTIKTNKPPQNTSITYIISIPRNTALNVTLKYGNMKVNRHEGAFIANLEYSDLSVQSFAKNSPNIVFKYGNLKVEEAKDITISASYSDVQVLKSEKITFSGDYNDCQFASANNMAATSAYSSFQIREAMNLNLNVQYGDLQIKGVANLNATIAFTDVQVKAMESPRLSGLNIQGNYSDISLALPAGTSATFDFNLNFGDLNIAKSHTVNYTVQQSDNNKTIRKGKIGTGNPTAKIVISNNYADIKIK